MLRAIITSLLHPNAGQHQPGSYRANSGVTLIEMAMVIAIIAIFATFAYTNLGNIDEDADARVLEALQANLQNTVTTAAEHLDVSPQGLLAQANSLQNILNAAKADDNPNLTVTINAGQYQVAYDDGRQAQLRVNNCGDVCLTSLTNFPNYQVVNENPSCGVEANQCGFMRRLP